MNRQLKAMHICLKPSSLLALLSGVVAASANLTNTESYPCSSILTAAKNKDADSNVTSVALHAPVRHA
jgi:hypothetical protein